MTSLLRGVTTETPSILPDGAVMGPSHAENAVPFPPWDSFSYGPAITAFSAKLERKKRRFFIWKG